MEKLNIAELLKDCPKGMELDCTMYDNVTFEGIKDVGYINILIKTPNGIFELSKNGCYHFHPNAKCVIFPKGKTTWEGFQRPFKDGDVVYIQCLYEYIVIYKETHYKNLYKHLAICLSLNNRLMQDENILCCTEDIKKIRFATEEEKQKLFDAIKENGYKWNPETKTLEKLIEPKFKVGDRIKHRLTGDVYKVLFVLSNGCGRGVYDVAVTNEIGKSIDIEEQDSYELVPNKFDITTLKPFDKVLVRIDKKWWADWFSHIDSNKNICCSSIGVVTAVIPFEGNEHLLGTTNDCDDYYKTWE